MKQQVIVIHGGTAFSEYSAFLHYLETCEVREPPGQRPDIWTKKLRDDLGEDFEVYMPTLPNKQNSKYEEWKIWFERHVEFLHDGAILIGHSLGGMFLAKYLSENVMPVKVAMLLLVAAPIQSDDSGGEDGGDFLFDSSHLKDIYKSVKDITIFHSRDDEIVPFAHFEQYHALLSEAETIIFEDRGHFLGETFPELVKCIRNT